MAINDDALNLLMDKHFRTPWDERLCRVCGRQLLMLHCSKRFCVDPFAFKRADAPLNHLTDAQVRLDREKLPEDQRRTFVDYLVPLVMNTCCIPRDYEWFLLCTTPRQQCIAMLRALGERIEG